jgi:hypothetical protein
MADIHIGRINKTGPGKGKARLFYHVPIDAPVSGIIPTPEGAIAGQLEQVEIDALAAGTLVEIAKDIVVSESQTESEVAAAIRADWQNVKADYNGQYDFEHKFYGVTLDAVV